jgi:hypothetical protein
MLAARRMRGRRLVRATAGAAVVAGTAAAVGGAVAHRQQQKYEQGGMSAYPPQEYFPPVGPQNAPPPQGYAPPAPPAPAPESDVATKLQQLFALHESGALSDEEFVAAKRALLGL